MITPIITTTGHIGRQTAMQRSETGPDRLHTRTDGPAHNGVWRPYGHADNQPQAAMSQPLENHLTAEELSNGELRIESIDGRMMIQSDTYVKVRDNL